MNIPRRISAVVVSVLVVAGGGLAAASAADSAKPAQAAPVERAHRYYLQGPSARYSSDSGSLIAPRPFAWRAPGDGSTTAVVEVSFQYRTKGPGPYVVNVGVREAGGKRMDVRPDELELAPAPEGTSTTVRFLVPDLEEGHTYKVSIGVNAAFSSEGINRIGTRKVLLTVESSS